MIAMTPVAPYSRKESTMFNVILAEAFENDASFDVIVPNIPTETSLRDLFDFVKEQAVGAARECGGIVDIGEGINGLPHADILLNNKVTQQIICEEI